MKQLTKELVEQAGIKLPEPTSYITAIGHQSCKNQLEKFLEIIVNECITECSSHFVGAVGTHASAHNSAVKKCVDGIKARFEI
jgi:hypothetical protein